MLCCENLYLNTDFSIEFMRVYILIKIRQSKYYGSCVIVLYFRIIIQMTSCPNIVRTLSESKHPRKTVTQLVQQLKHPMPFHNKTKNSKPQLDIQLIRSQMKKKWRGSGFGNVQFSQPPILKAKMLNQWEYERISLAERSYKFPKGHKGYHYDSHSRKFQQPTRDMLPPKFNLYLDKLSARYQQNRFKLDPQLTQKGERIKRMITESGVQSSTKKQFHKSGFFGYSSLKQKMKTINY